MEIGDKVKWRTWITYIAYRKRGENCVTLELPGGWQKEKSCLAKELKNYKPKIIDRYYNVSICEIKLIKKNNTKNTNNAKFINLGKEFNFKQ